MKLTVAQHEAAHMRMSMFRRLLVVAPECHALWVWDDNYQPFLYKWNVAADYRINTLLRDYGVQLTRMGGTGT